MMLNELTGLTGLRFLAAFYVFAFHIHIRQHLTFLPASLQTVVSVGALGVTVFFTLSGFILTYAHLKDFPAAQFTDSSYYGRFLIKRLARIYPAYFVGMLACLVVNYGLQDFPSKTVVALDATLLQSYIPSLSMEWYGGQAWSVSTEFFFYLLFPLLLPLLLRLNRAALAGLLVVTILASSGPGLVYVVRPWIQWESTYSFPPSRLAEFVSGIILGILVLKYKVRISGHLALGLLAFAGLYLVEFGFRWPSFTVHHAAVLPAILATIGVLSQGVPTGLLSWIGGPTFRYLGKISYSFYIMQMPLMVLYDGLLAKQRILRTDLRAGPIIFLVNLALGALLYALVEDPAHKLLVRSLLSKPLPKRGLT